MGRFMTAQPSIITSVRISPEFHSLCRENGISLTEALRVGISLMLAERDIREYDNNLNVYRKMRLFQQELEKMSIEFNAMKEKQQTSNDIKQVFNG